MKKIEMAVQGRKGGRYYLAVACRAHSLGITVMTGGKIVEIFRHRLIPNQNVHVKILHLTTKIALDYAVSLVITEESSMVCKIVSRHFIVKTLSLKNTKRTILTGVVRPTQRQLFQYLIEHHVSLRRLVSISKQTGQLTCNNDLRRTVPLLAVALALAWQKT